MRQDAGLDGDAQRLSQISWLLFLKIFDDQESELEILRDRYASPIPKDLRWRSWAADAEGLTGDALLDLVNNRSLPRSRTSTPTANATRAPPSCRPCSRTPSTT